MIGFGSSDVVWYVVAALAAGFSLAFVSGVRRFVQWGVRRTKTAFLEWFQEAIDEHIDPRFEQMRRDMFIATETIKADATAKSAIAVAELRLHTSQEGEIVKGIVDEAIRPIQESLDHLTNGDK